MANQIDSNVTGLAYAEETTLKVLPGVSEANAVWYTLEPNSYSDFGGDLSTVARAPINASRQRQKGTITDLDASGGFNTDFTQNNLMRLLQGFFFADMREKASTQPLNGTQVAIASATSTTFTAASGLGVFKANHLVLASGFTNAGNNGLKLLSAAAAGSVTTTGNTAEAAPPAAAKLEAVGFQFLSGEISLAVSASSIALNSSGTNLTTLGLTPGEWVFIGGDTTVTRFADSGNNAPFYGRIKSIAAAQILFSETTGTVATDAGTGKTIRMFFGKVLRNENATNLIKRRSYNLERQLGSDGVGTQSELLLGAIPNEFTLNVPQADKLNADLSFVALDNVSRTGTQGLKAGTRIAAPGEAAFNTSSNVYRSRMNIVDPTTLNNSSLFAYVSEITISINNNVTPSKAVGVLGAFEASAGDFEVSGNITAYFATVSAVQAVRNNSDVAYNLITASNNAGLVFDIPLMALGGGRLNVEKDSPITVPIEQNAAENPLGYTMLMAFFQYLPTVAMPV